MYSTKKLVLAGNIVHLFEYSKPIEYGYQDKEKKQSKFGIFKEFNEDEFNSNDYRAKKRIKLICQANSFQWYNSENRPFNPLFITFTFRENVQFLKEANYTFEKFNKRLNYQITGSKKSSLKYLVVPEFQPISGRVHYHSIFFNFPYVTSIYDKIFKIWGNGFTNVQTIKSDYQIINYLTKYLAKNSKDHRLDGEKKYFTSKGLIQPQEYRQQPLVELMQQLLPQPNTTQEFVNQSITTKYKCYRLNEEKKYYMQSFLQAFCLTSK